MPSSSFARITYALPRTAMNIYFVVSFSPSIDFSSHLGHEVASHISIVSDVFYHGESIQRVENSRILSGREFYTNLFGVRLYLSGGSPAEGL